MINVNDRSYASYRFFARQLADALANKGCIIEFCSVEPGEQGREEAWGRALEKAQAFHADAVIDFNSFLPKLSVGNKALPELFDAPFYNYILDHPLYHHDALIAKLTDSRCICVANEHEVYIKKYYPHVHSVFTNSLPGSVGDSATLKFEERQNRILFCGTYEDPERYMKLMNELPKTLGIKCKQMAEVMLGNTDMTLEDALSCDAPQQNRTTWKQKTVITNKILPEQMKVYFLVDAYVRHTRRKRVLCEMIKAELPLDLYGNGWELLIGEGMKRDVLSKGPRMGRICRYPAVSYENYVNLVGKYRIALNMMPGFMDGSHDRITCAMRNGTAVITDRNLYIDRHYQLVTKSFLPEEPLQAVEMSNRLLEDTYLAGQLADRGKRYGDQNHTWESLADRLLADLKEK